MTESFDLLVLIGRFQPFHLGHQQLIQAGLKRSKRLVIIVGSSQCSRSCRNPWGEQERTQMIRASLTATENACVNILSVKDNTYNDWAWINEVNHQVKAVVREHFSQTENPIIGCLHGDELPPGYYAEGFPDWRLLNVECESVVCGSHIREALWQHEAVPECSVPIPVEKIIQAFCAGRTYHSLQQEYAFVKQFRQSWEVAPYPPVFMTVDALVVHRGHVLLVERNGCPGKGLMALPGGFLDQQETLQQACLRELAEETCLGLSETFLQGCIIKQRLFDAPFRSARGRTLTQVFHFELPDEISVPEVKGGDDAKRALWVPLDELNSALMFEDHYAILQAMQLNSEYIAQEYEL